MSGGHGGRLELELGLSGGRTRPRRSLATPPLQISRARYEDPASPARVSLTLIHLGGVLAGDSYDLAVDLSAGAEALVVGAAATQVYTMAGAGARQRTTLRAGRGAALRWAPGPQILFAGARYCQSTRVALSPGAFVALGETLVPGRLARGERWGFTHYESSLEVADEQGGLLAAEHVLIEPQRRSPRVAGSMGGLDVLSSLWLLGDGLDAPAAARLVGARPGPVSAAILPGGCGLLLRALGGGIADARRATESCYQALSAAGLAPRLPATPD